MKKIFFSLAAIVAAITMQAQNPTVSTSYVDFQYCVDKTETKDTIIPDCKFPYTWNGVLFNAEAFTGGYALDKKSDAKTTTGLKTKRGCDSTLTMTVTYQDLTTYHNTVIADYCSKDLPYIWTVDGVNYEYNASTKDRKTSTQVNEHGCNDVYTLDLTVVKCPPTGAIPYVFTAGGGNHQIFFSMGTLQFCPNPQEEPKQYTYENYDNYNKDLGTTSTATGSWRFAVPQYDITRCAGGPGPNATWWIDMYAYGASGFRYSPTNHGNWGGVTDGVTGGNDWGIRNAISNGGNAPKTWRTPTKEELQYILETRSGDGWVATDRCGSATIQVDATNTVRGMVILPDEWIPVSDVTFTPNNWNAATNTYSTSDWDKLAANGAVFLPCAGGYSSDYMRYDWFGERGFYWTATKSTSSYSSYTYVYRLDYDGSNKYKFSDVGVSSSQSGMGSVRLVADAD